jgi:hypothetical protein
MPEPVKWSLKDTDLQDLNPQKARDLIIKCFFEAQKETFKQAKEKLNKAADNEVEILQRIVSVVKVSFQQMNTDFEQPTKESLSKVIERLVLICASWGTPADIIEYHHKQIERVLNALS